MMVSQAGEFKPWQNDGMNVYLKKASFYAITVMRSQPYISACTWYLSEKSLL